jgi:hypothetical protein
MLPNDTYREPITSVTAVLLPFVTLLALSRTPYSYSGTKFRIIRVNAKGSMLCWNIIVIDFILALF